MRSALLRFAASTLALLVAGQADAAYDMSGKWATVHTYAYGHVSVDHWDVTQTGSDLEVLLLDQGDPPPGVPGVIDVDTGQFTIFLPFYCGENSITGSVAADSLSFTAVWHGHERISLLA